MFSVERNFYTLIAPCIYTKLKFHNSIENILINLHQFIFLMFNLLLYKPGENIHTSIYSHSNILFLLKIFLMQIFVYSKWIFLLRNSWTSSKSTQLWSGYKRLLSFHPYLRIFSNYVDLAKYEFMLTSIFAKVFFFFSNIIIFGMDTFVFQ